MSIAQRIKSYRTTYFKTAKALAEKINVSSSAISQAEKGQSLPSAVLLKPLSDLGVSIDWIMTGEGTMMRDSSKKNIDNRTINANGDGNTNNCNTSHNTNKKGSNFDVHAELIQLQKEKITRLEKALKAATDENKRLQQLLNNKS